MAKPGIYFLDKKIIFPEEENILDLLFVGKNLPLSFTDGTDIFVSVTAFSPLSPIDDDDSIWIIKGIEVEGKNSKPAIDEPNVVCIFDRKKNTGPVRIL